LRECGFVAGILPVDPARVVVLHLMVVPGDDPRERGVRRLEIRVGLVLRVPVAVVRQAEAPPALGVLANDVAASVPLVDVITEEEDRVQILACEVGVRRVVALRVVLAGGEREVQRLRCRTDSWCGARSADGTLGAARAT